MGDLGNELDKLAAEIEGLARDPQQGQTEHDREHERLTGLVHALESGGDLSGYDPEEVEELRGVL